MSSFILTEMEDLRLFLQERVREFDPTVDTTIGSTFDTAVIQPLLTRLGPDPYNTAIRDFLLSRLRTEFPELVLQDGEPLDDYLVKPLQILLEPFRRQIQQVSNNQSLADPESLNEREANNLAANYFVSRRLGGFAVGSARLYWSAPQFAQVNPTNTIRTGGGLVFIPIESQAITADNMLFNIEDNLYYFDVIVRAEKEGSAYNIEPNSLTSVDGITSVVKVTNKVKFEEGVDKETTTEFLARVKNSLTEKSLVTTRGITARMLEVFDSIRLIQVIGYGDPEMMRDILKGTSDSAPYAVAVISTPDTSGAGTAFLDLFGDLYPNTGGIGNFSVVSAGDKVLLYNTTTQQVWERTVESVVSTTRIKLTANVPDNMPLVWAVFMPVAGNITISDIPGGMTDPETPVVIKSDEVHIGGMTDVFVRGSEPQLRNTTIDGVLDGSPLRFGIDLESFGEAAVRPVQLNRQIDNMVCVPGKDRYGTAVTDHLLVKQYQDSNGRTLWKPTIDDVGRRIQLLGGTELNFGTFEILEYLGDEYVTDTLSSNFVTRATRLRISTTDEESGSPFSLIPTPLAFGINARFIEALTIKDLVRDRDGSTIAVPGVGNPDNLGGVNFTSIGASIGDSVVIETGDDAGIYSIRRILSWLGNNDTLVLDRDLTKTVTPGGTGDGSGLRYRVADALNVDLIKPRVTKIPLGSIFSGNDLNTTAGSPNINVTGDTNFLLAGVVTDDTLEILEGENAGQYKVKSVTATTAVLDRPVLSTSFSALFTVYRAYLGVDRPLVRVKEIEILDSNSQPTGVIIPYGKEVDVRVKGALANRAQGSVVESMTGQTADDGTGKLLRFEDPEVDFTDPDIDLAVGYRLNILNTSSVGHYVIAEVNPTYLLVEPEANGGTEFNEISSAVHYTIGLPSAGYARLYFVNPTSVQIQTGLVGARLQTDEDTPKEFIVSKVDGFTTLPAAGSTEAPRDLRVVHNIPDGPNYKSTVELTDDTRPGVFELEIQNGDVLEVNQEVPFRAVRPVEAGNLTWNGTLTVAGATANPTLRIGHFIRRTTALSDWFEITNIVGNNITIVNPHSYTLPSGGSAASEYSATFAQMGIFGKPAGLRTIAGSNLVTIPSGSLIDFQAMDAISGLVGQRLMIDVGPDAGAYIVESVVSAKSLRLDKVMTATTAAILAQGGTTPAGSLVRDPYLEQSGTKTNLVDLTETPSNVPNHFITLYEGNRKDLFGTFEISQYLSLSKVELDLDPASDIVNPNGQRVLTGDQTDGTTTGGGLFEDTDATFAVDGVRPGDTLVITNLIPGRYRITLVTATQLTVSGGLTPGQSGLIYYIEATESEDPFKWGRFNWVRTSVDTTVEQEFRVYENVPTQVAVTEVAPRRDDLFVGPAQGNITYSNRLTTATVLNFVTLGVTRGDILEILAGPNAGVYWILTVASTYVEIQGAFFPVLVTGVPFRIWPGVRGSPSMLTVGTYGVSNGKLEPGPSLPYKILRPSVYRVSSTEMSDNFDGTLYYADVQIESLGSGDEFNLEQNVRLVFQSGIAVDGYQYTVENNVLTFSPYEEVSLVFDRRFLPVGNSDSPENLTEVSGRNIKITYDTSVVAGLVNDLLRSYFDRPMNSNPLGRHFLPSYVLVTLRYEGGVSADEVGTEIEEYINNLGAEQVLEVSDVEAFLTRRGATSIRHPIELVTVTHDLDRNLIVNRSEDVLGGTNVVPYNGTGRISAFFAILGEGLTVTKS